MEDQNQEQYSDDNHENGYNGNGDSNGNANGKDHQSYGDEVSYNRKCF